MDPQQLQDKYPFERERMNRWALLDKPVSSGVQFQNPGEPHALLPAGVCLFQRGLRDLLWLGCFDNSVLS